MALTGTTDASGTVTIANVPAGQVTVSATPPAGFSTPPSQTVAVTAGQTVSVKFQVTAEGTLSASVVDQSGAPVAGVVVAVS